MPKAKRIPSREERAKEPLLKSVSNFTEAQRNHYQYTKTQNPTTHSLVTLKTKPVWTKTLHIKGCIIPLSLVF